MCPPSAQPFTLPHCMVTTILSLAPFVVWLLFAALAPANVFLAIDCSVLPFELYVKGIHYWSCPVTSSAPCDILGIRP